jgi:hypothetical protein
MIWLLLNLLSRQSSTVDTQEDRERQLADGRRRWGWWDDGEKAWSSRNHSIFSGGEEVVIRDYTYRSLHFTFIPHF